MSSQEIPPAVWHAVGSCGRQDRAFGNCACPQCTACRARDVNDETWRRLRHGDEDSP